MKKRAHIIPRSAGHDHADWQRQLAEGFRDARSLLAWLGLPARWADSAAEAAFPLRVPLAYARRMRRRDPADPLLRQVLPCAREREPAPGFVADPLEERGANPLPGLLHKYAGRALLVTTGACAVHCRYCFRRHFPYAEQRLDGDRLEALVRWLQDHPEIREVILSGGDPLTLANARLARLLARLEALPSLARLRIHTRLPVVLPDRVDDGLLDLARHSRLPWVLVIHANHPREIDAHVIDACRRLDAAGVRLLNQSVLLAGVNDDAETLAALSERLFDARVLPYYLHLLDPVAGAAHFRVSTRTALAIQARLRARLPGYLVPRLVRETPGAPAKVPLSPVDKDVPSPDE
ncbi:MAG: EF-P beta-lysylation protein EpmB [Gammaproteobacteria bacterium]|nr:MAG: EF-P beta-lysylation protein EpmB [Gammaproteobacteria bacterium]